MKVFLLPTDRGLKKDLPSWYLHGHKKVGFITHVLSMTLHVT